MQRAIFQPPVHLKRNGIPESHRTANLPLEAAVQYGLLSRGTYHATDLTIRLSGLSGAEMAEEFAKHILLRLNGLRIVESIQQMTADFEAGLSEKPVTADDLAYTLSQQGFNVTEHNTAINTMRLWLAEAGVFPTTRGRAWEVNEERLYELVGLSRDEIAALAEFNENQKAFLRVLCRVNPPSWHKAADIRDLAEATEGVRFGRSSLPNEVLTPLENAGLIEQRSGGTRGGKTATLRTTESFQSEVLAPFLEYAVDSFDPVVTRYYRYRPEDIYSELMSTDRYKKGLALEAYSIYLMRLLGLRLIEWRKRARDTTGQAEVDVLLAGVFGGTATTWQVQCKNTPNSTVDLEDIAKEVGIATITKVSHIMFAANGRFTRDARQFARRVMLETPLSVYILDADDFGAIQASPGVIGNILRKQSEAIVRLRLAKPLWSADS